MNQRGANGRKTLSLILGEGLMMGTDKESRMSAKYEYMASSCGAEHRFPAINRRDVGETEERKEQQEGCYSGR